MSQVTTSPDDVFLDLDGLLARYPTLTPSAVYSARHRGEAPGSLGVRVGRRILWRKSDLDAWWEAQLEQAAR